MQGDIQDSCNASIWRRLDHRGSTATVLGTYCWLLKAMNRVAHQFELSQKPLLHLPLDADGDCTFRSHGENAVSKRRDRGRDVFADDGNNRLLTSGLPHGVRLRQGPRSGADHFHRCTPLSTVTAPSSAAAVSTRRNLFSFPSTLSTFNASIFMTCR
ncbi:hypothetical protein PYCCODRAFT_993408 [Trametes coccinea BRFM310]|uniref:Uncharacterized protein n=1 Tax=Trametes coccinea (strain BRFM310) TaxID=1353009 RepID=A0A1Y2IBP4_TRAC3|nr:hypothetical protein PYCCODRAFT_993408 [Trametes coccinea BRFM310]